MATELGRLPRATAGQAEAVRFIRTRAVGHALRRAIGDHVFVVGRADAGVGLVGRAVSVNQIVFDAAARKRASHSAALAQRHDGAHRARRRTPRADHGGEQGALALGTKNSTPSNSAVYKAALISEFSCTSSNDIDVFANLLQAFLVDKKTITG